MRYLKLFESTNGDVQEILDGLEDIWVELTDEFYVNLDIEHSHLIKDIGKEFSIQINHSDTKPEIGFWGRLIELLIKSEKMLGLKFCSITTPPGWGTKIYFTR